MKLQCMKSLLHNYEFCAYFTHSLQQLIKISHYCCITVRISFINYIFYVVENIRQRCYCSEIVIEHLIFTS